MSKQRNEMLNIMEAIAAILVVFIHFKFPGWTGNAATAIARISVPFFFSISGYFFYKHDSAKELASIPRKIKHLLQLILCSEAVYFAYYYLLQADNCGFTFQAIANVIELEIRNDYCKDILNWISVFAPPLNGVFWFVGSLVVVYICMFYITKYKLQQKVFAVSLFLLVIGYVLRRILFYNGVTTLFPYERILPFLPFPFFMIGYYIRKYQDRFDQISNRIYCGAFVLGIFLTLLELHVEKGEHTLYGGTLILVPAILSFGGKQKHYIAKSAAEKYLSHIGADTATYIYMLHTIIGNICSIMVPRVLNMDPTQSLYLWLLPLLTCVASMVCGEIIYLIKQVICKHR